MYTLVITFKEGMPIFPYSIRYDGELIHYKIYDNDLDHSVHTDNIAEVKLISLKLLNSYIRHI